MPTSPAPDVLATRLAEVARRLPELDLIGSAELRRAVAEIWVECWQESGWDRLEDAPKSPSEPARLSLVRHTRGVTRLALAMAETARDTYRVGFDRDRLVAGALLHDVSKLVEWEPGPAGTVATRRGTLVQHGVYAAHKAWQHDLPDVLVHIIVSHSEQSARPPATWECELV